jgi:glyceraldehyde 3-phosphate dehydrogenase
VAIKVGINGFGRIGRNIVRTTLNHTGIEFVAVNDLTDAKTLAHLLKYDSVLGNLKEDVTVAGDSIQIGNKKIKVFAERDPANLNWESVGAQIVVESTGKFTEAEGARKHLRGTVKKVIISAPAKNEDITIVLGVNDRNYDPAKHHIISNASCTTNCLGPACKVVVDELGWENAFMVTVHSYTNDQVVLDGPHKDMRRARNAATNIIPTSTGAAKALFLTIPEVKGAFDGFALRVPTPTVSMVYLVANTKKATTKDELNGMLKRAAEGSLKGILQYTDEELVSSDFKLNSHSSIVDGKLTGAQGKMIQLGLWYDNEWGYSCRLADVTQMVLAKLPTGVA